MKMENIEVFANTNGQIVLLQPRGCLANAVVLFPDQLDVVIKWMLEAKKEIPPDDDPEMDNNGAS